MYDELVKQCRDCINCLCGDCKYEYFQEPGNFVKCMNALLGEAADAIEELNHRIDQANEETLSILKKKRDTMEHELYVGNALRNFNADAIYHQVMNGR